MSLAVYDNQFLKEQLQTYKKTARLGAAFYEN